MEALLVVGIVCVALAVVALAARDPLASTRLERARHWALALVLGGAVVAGRALAPAPATAAPDPRVPRTTDTGGDEYVTSRACRSCHPKEHASWRASFHSTMTQVADARTVLAPTDATFSDQGRTWSLFTRGDEVWARGPDLAALAERGDATPVERRVVLTTGSHNEQGYWVAGRREGELRLLPFVWVRAEARWVPRRDAFVQPPEAPQHFVRWNSNCIQCHATGGRPGHDLATDRFETEAVELGIACEACHGPGAAHVRAHKSPVERWSARARTDRRPDPTIVQPAKLAADLGAAVCGQCHSYAYPKDEEEWWLRGYTTTFRPGRSLDTSRFLLTLEKLGAAGVPAIDAETESLYWKDGAIRVGGREYNALVVSACHARGQGDRKATCTSCHSIHDGAPDDQLDPRGLEAGGDAMCARCHEPEARAGPAHTRHAPASSGARCVACHMPMTTYALFKTIRAHTIDSPSAAKAVTTGRPTACNLCHLDRPLGWTATWLERWWGQPRPALSERDERVSPVVSGALRGDAAVRVVAAAALGDDAALAASGKDFAPVALAAMLADPYTAVRRVAWRSLARLDARAAALDPLGPEDARARLRADVFAGARIAGDPARRAALLARPDGTPDEAALAAELAERDDRAVTIAE